MYSKLWPCRKGSLAFAPSSWKVTSKLLEFPAWKHVCCSRWAPRTTPGCKGFQGGSGDGVQPHGQGVAMAMYWSPSRNRTVKLRKASRVGTRRCTVPSSVRRGPPVLENAWVLPRLCSVHLSLWPIFLFPFPATNHNHEDNSSRGVLWVLPANYQTWGWFSGTPPAPHSKSCSWCQKWKRSCGPRPQTLWFIKYQADPERNHS